ncbi:hypothetical protein N7471_008609 [Penicillium samsonianum]|uniref:uncharacterized protein n=1 Tax=Penicillium samsonianum TaxID=1882272 RepID=UPI00254874B1|nr:uncharacterized protein N7471_008609 [Penicillium samsonianum]KAJ6133394.1 hypothetical protein N7471_008609 [Penicillium samsonianum]
MTAANTSRWSAETILGHLKHYLRSDRHLNPSKDMSMDGQITRSETLATSAGLEWLGIPQEWPGAFSK